MTSTFTPTPEQLACLAAAATGEHFKMKALAGSGKTSTLRLIAEANPNTTFRYLAFNKAIVTEAQESMPANVKASTVHSLAFGAVGRTFAKRLNGSRVPAWQLAKLLRVSPITLGDVYLDSEIVATSVMATMKRFAATADREVSVKHVPYIEGIDMPTDDGKRTYENNNLFAAHLEQYFDKVWSDLSSTSGTLPFDHAYYLKMYELSDPKIREDVVLFDEAQDCTTVMQSIVANQLGRAQVIAVGDDFQAIYEWAGAHNALNTFPGESCYLTQSFRFGSEVAERANVVLDRLDAGVHVRGNEARNSVVGPIAEPDAILARTNAVVVSRALELLSSGKKVAIVGGAQEIVRFAEGAQSLIETGRTKHSDLRLFKSWDQVQAYTKKDEGSDLKLLVSLIDKFGTTTIIDGLSACTKNEDAADIILSTAHKSKGREWNAVTIDGSDFPTGEDPKRPLSDEMLRLGYVSVTRAKHELDCGSLAMAWAPAA